LNQADLQPSTLAAILDLGRLVCSSLDLDEVLSRVLTATHNLSGADVISIMLLDEDATTLMIVASLGIPLSVQTGTRMALGEGIAGWVARHSIPFHAVRPNQDTRYKAFLEAPQACLFSLPLRVRDRVVGVLNMARSYDETLFNPAVVQTVEIFASHAAIAIENAAAAAALRHAAARERMVRLVSQAAHSAGGAEPLIDPILADVGSTIEAGSCALILVDDNNQPYTKAIWTASEPTPPHDPAPNEPANPATADHHARSELVHTPLPYASGISGWLITSRPCTQRYWRRDERGLLEFAAEQIAQALLNAQRVADDQRSRALNRTFSRLAAACNAMIDQASVLDYILEQLAGFITYDSASVFLYHDTQYARMAAARGFAFNNTDVVLYMGPGSFTWRVQQQRRALYIPDVQQEPGWQNVPGSDRVHAWIGVPLLVNTIMVGVLAIDKWTPNAFSSADVQVAQMFGDHMAVAIHNARLLQEAQTRANQLLVLHQLSARLGAIQAITPLLTEVAQLLHTSFGYYQILIGLVEDHEIVLQAACGRINDLTELGQLQRQATGSGISGWVARHGQTQLVNDVRADRRYVFHSKLADTAAELITPIMSAGKVLGVIIIDSTRTGEFSQSDVYLAEAIAGQAAVALENIRRYSELQRTQEHLLHSERLRALGELASGVAHDFNNLLAAILGHTQILLSEVTDPQIGDSLSIIERAALDGAATVRRLRSFAQTGEQPPEELVDLNDIIEESLGLTRPRWRDAMQLQGVPLQITRSFGALPKIPGDSAALRELVMNLVLNALDAMPLGGELHVGTGASGTDGVVLEVRDTGLGMDAAVQQRIFDPFFSTKGVRGTGMGLAMSAAIVQRHNGTITVTSAPEQGATFRVWLPSAPLAATTAAAPTAPAPLRAESLAILIAEDDAAVRHILRQLLARQGHRVDAVDSGEAALERLRHHSYDVLCSDLGMPTMSGWELIRHARRLHPELYTILITGWGDQIGAEEARERGVDRVLAKPFDAGQLNQALTTIHQERSPAWRSAQATTQSVRD
jgi:signal transduction histidine kinase/CheY-like chemotaxis protein